MCWVMPPASPAATSVCADGVQQRRLAVVDVAHDRDHRGARLELLVGVLELRLVARLVGGVDDLDLLVELVREHLDRVVRQRLRERRHLAQAHQLLDDVRDRDAEVLADVLDRRPRVDLDDVGLQRRDVLRGRLHVAAAAAAPTAPGRTADRAAGPTAGTAARAAGTAARGLRVDDDAAHAAGRAGRALALQRGARRALARRAVRRRGLVAFGLGGVGRLAVRRRPSRFCAASSRCWRSASRCLAVSDAGLSKPMPVCAGVCRLAACGLPVGLLLRRLAGERALGLVLVHGRRRRLDLEAIGVQLRHDLRGGHVVLLG